MANATNAQKTEKTEKMEVKRSVMAEVIEEGYLPMLVSGNVWEKTPEEITAIRESLGKFLTAIKTACKMYDEELKTRRAINGTDYLKGVEYFRKPRDSKSGEGNSLLNDLSL